jgi:hypothetical protein
MTYPLVFTVQYLIPNRLPYLNMRMVAGVIRTNRKRGEKWIQQ